MSLPLSVKIHMCSQSARDKARASTNVPCRSMASSYAKYIYMCILVSPIDTNRESHNPIGYHFHPSDFASCANLLLNLPLRRESKRRVVLVCRGPRSLRPHDTAQRTTPLTKPHTGRQQTRVKKIATKQHVLYDGAYATARRIL